MTRKVDLAIIGSGSGNSLITPFWDGKRVALAEAGVFGGTCLNVGCIPTKMFVRPAALARSVEEAGRLGVTQRTEHVDWKGIRDRIFSRIDAISDAGRIYRDDELENVELVQEEVRLDGPKSFVTPGGERIEADQLVIATGSRPHVPDIPGITLPGVHTSDTVMRIEELPQQVVIIGGGYIACEFAGIFSGLGSSVVQLVRSGKLLKRADDEVIEAYALEAARHWDLRFHCSATRIVPKDGRLSVEVERRDDGVSVDSIAADIVLVATGRTPNSDRVGARDAGLDVLDDGRIAVDEFQRVCAGGEALEGVYALGDVSSLAQLKHVANHEARTVAHNLEHPDDLRRSDLEPVPAAVFTDPEIAVVGLTEDAAVREIGRENVTAKTQRYGETAYGWAMEDQAGLFKIVADRRDGRILGANAMGYQASNLIQVIVSAMSFGVDAHRAARGQYWIHPALMEVVENALLGLDVPESGLL